jgi:hypothetical protein
MRERHKDVLAIAWMKPVIFFPLCGRFGVGLASSSLREVCTVATCSMRSGLSWMRSGPVSDPNTSMMGTDQVLKWCLDLPPLAGWLIIVFPFAWILLWDRDNRL